MLQEHKVPTTGPTHAVNPRLTALMDEQKRTANLVREGDKLAKEQAADLEGALAKSPAELAPRAKLLGYYFSNASSCMPLQERIEARRGHILWLLAHQPDSPLFWTSEATIDQRGDKLADPEGYEQAKDLWLQQTAKKDVSSATLGCAGRFFFLPDKRLAAGYFARAHELDPQFPLWTIMHGSVLAFAVVGITAMNENGFPGPADPAEASSDFSKSAMQELKTSKDPDLLAAVAGELAQRGFMAQTMAKSATKTQPPFDALVLAEALLKRAEELKPGNHSALLGRIYEIRAMSAKTDDEKKTLARSRYEQLDKSVSGLSPDDPANWNAFLNLARASVDAGELVKAQTLAKSLIGIVPQLQQATEGRGAADTIWHQGHIILGRVALRNGDISPAKENLLEAAHVNGGGTLSSFGPNMMLAKELLEKGEKDVVLQYLELCRKFWRSNNMNSWVDAINRGEMPHFGANLNY
jgi:hypothetical protein